MQLRAPFAGTVVSVAVKVGDIIDPAKPVVTLAKPGAPIVRATLTPSDAGKVSVGQNATLQITGQTDVTFDAHVSSITANAAGTAKIVIFEVPWGDTSPKLGSVANVGIVLDHKSDVLIVPKKAVHTAGARSFVEVAVGNTHRAVDVQTGIVGATDAEILKGLTPGQLVVVGP